ncbi:MULTISPECIES: SDR family oxidoreductase [Desulfococcus]|uniref:Short-chain dehydrogenase/reductase SDR n=1 Tax=Desulfococcus multivorans DSM 2059 TaxID=1121405 RepID=S7U4G5_DESML|nr:SDR family oxidoreductase [Desulfococcus multivorans]AOY57651.1 short chain dehydrogenase/reductase [Desulfococcus multivorans]AQV02873.1 3-oxoacyl-ACP reductase [Desulfococcus multivorans]EPR44172.1 short-chain dehydrogenase/reductase SDR [Desulfococcus multivorans DSM 2059]SJZ78029.1 NAD(P)-dependent dehydrogenase, short-chain alcohol dehydrogenase family [Desulfococcus multivorans DSM 2059]
MKPVSEQSILITGATDGIGRITAERLAQMGARVLLHGRDPEKCRAARDEIRRETGSDKLEFYVADFSSLPEVRRMAAEVLAAHDGLDVLINNAGVLPVPGGKKDRPRSDQGHELCMAVNYLAPFLLTILLLPLLRASGAARIVNVSSAAQEAIDFEDFMLADGYSPMRAYARSKLALAMFTIELDRRLKSDGITVNCLHPGSLLDTKMVRQAFGTPQGTAESGAEVEVYVAVSPDVDGVSGAYFDRMTQAEAHAQAYDAEIRQRLWALSLELTDAGAGTDH